MTAKQPGPAAEQPRMAHGALWGAWRIVRKHGPNRTVFWFVALIVGIVSGSAAIAFRKAISALQTLFYSTDDVMLASVAKTLPWWWIVIVPVVGGLVVGVLLDRFTSDARVRSVADVIEGAAMQNGRVEKKEGVVSALASLITLSSGGSTGREGPVVHLAGVVSTWVADKMHADGISGRDLLGCAVAAAVSASFNAPIAGALFALEVVLRHFAIHAFAPIVIASVAGTVISRLVFGEGAEFILPQEGSLDFYVELPAFLLLGGVCGIIAVLMMTSIFWAEQTAGRMMTIARLPRWLRPAISGLMLGVIAIWFPHIIGVGYETITLALTGQLSFEQAVIFTVVKCVAVAVTISGRMGGGIFSPALMVGAMSGLAFGLVATAIFPTVSGSETVYALAGMGAVAAAVLGAPISTTLIVFELTGDWQTGIAVMTAVSLSTAMASRLVERSFFLTQLERRGLHLAAGPQAYLLATLRVTSAMREISHPEAPEPDSCIELMNKGYVVENTATLQEVMPLFDKAQSPFLPVIERPKRSGPPEIVGAVFLVDALRVYTRALAETAAEEHS